MKLDITSMRYLTKDDFKVLGAVENGSRTHEVVPTTLIHNLSGLRSMSGTQRAISDLARLSLISKVRNAKYDGYRLTYNGFDYVALKGLLNHGVIKSLGSTIGVGKESDIYTTEDMDGKQKVLKIHRLGRVSFRTVKNKRDYLKNSQNGSWMFLSQLAAEKEYNFLSSLYLNGFNVPQPFDVSRHQVLMEWIPGFPMRQLKEYKDCARLYSDLMKFIVKLANYGLIHCDFNEFNIIITEKEPKFVVIDFPQCISIEHPDAEEYFQRDVDCIRRFFKKKLGYEPVQDKSMVDTDGFGDGFRHPYPVMKRDVVRCCDLDKQLQASGYSKNLKRTALGLEDAMQAMRIRADNASEEEEEEVEESDNVEESDFEDEYDSLDEVESLESSESGESDHESGNEEIIEALSNGDERLKVDKMGNYYLEE